MILYFRLQRYKKITIIGYFYFLYNNNPPYSAPEQRNGFSGDEEVWLLAES
jgi:hypothetical protein